MKFLYLFLIVLGLHSVTQAQSSSLYVFFQQSTGPENMVDGVKFILNVDKTVNKPILASKSVVEKETYFDAFIIRPSVDNNTKYVYLIAAHDPNLYLKRTTSGTLEFKDITTETNTSKSNYEWELQYSGDQYITIVDPYTSRRVLYNENSIPVLKVITQDLSIPNDANPSDDPYRFKIKKLDNTF